MIHYHVFKTPIISKYVNFYTRDIIFECKCGKRKIKRVVRDFNKPFPIKTSSLISQKEFISNLK